MSKSRYHAVHQEIENAGLWRKVFPLCFFNVLLTCSLFYGRRVGIDLSFSGAGHTFMSIMISFLVVTRSQTVYQRYMETRHSLTDMFRSGRELVQYVCLITEDRKDEEAVRWREDVAYQVIALLKISTHALKYTSRKVDSWRHEPGDIIKEVKKNLSFHPVSSGLGANNRIPLILACHLRKTILSQRTGAFKENNLNIVEELKLLASVKLFMSSWKGLTKLITTPYPFPIVQMGRLFLLFWLLSIPFVLSAHIEDPIQIVIVIVFITYGFAGLECVSIELDDPFGDDPNDFHAMKLNLIAIDDILIQMLKTDGVQSELNLRKRANLEEEIHVVNDVVIS